MRSLALLLALTLRLNLRSGQALAYGYLVPVLFLLAFGSVFRTSQPPLVHEMGQLLTITVLGGACFGLPVALVSERERGVWRRYRLLPGGLTGLLVATLLARLVIVGTAAVIQLLLARAVFGTPLPAQPVQLLLAFLLVAFAFLGLGLVITSLASTVAAVQALGQALFLPMILIGGVGVPLRLLPGWAQELAAFLPGRYAVEVFGAALTPGQSVADVLYGALALLLIGAAGCLTGTKLFRWDPLEPLPGRTRAWAAVALAACAAVGLVAKLTGRVDAVDGAPPLASATSPAGSPPRGCASLTDAQVQDVAYDDLPPDDGVVTPFGTTLDEPNPELQQQVARFVELLRTWPPGRERELCQRVRNLVATLALTDLRKQSTEHAYPLVVEALLQRELAPRALRRALAWVALKPSEGTIPPPFDGPATTSPSFETAIRQRSADYARKLLGRQLGRWPTTRDEQR